MNQPKFVSNSLRFIIVFVQLLVVYSHIFYIVLNPLFDSWQKIVHIMLAILVNSFFWYHFCFFHWTSDYKFHTLIQGLNS